MVAGSGGVPNHYSCIACGMSLCRRAESGLDKNARDKDVAGISGPCRTFIVSSKVSESESESESESVWYFGSITDCFSVWRLYKCHMLCFDAAACVTAQRYST